MLHATALLIFILVAVATLAIDPLDFDTAKLMKLERNTKSETIKPEKLTGSSFESSLPIFPERSDAVYFIVAVPGGIKSWGNTLARTLLDMGPPFESPQGPPLRPLFVDLPQKGRFTSDVLNTLCHQSDGNPLAGMIVIGDGQSARAISLAGSAMKLPVVWARGGKATLYGLNHEIQSTLQAVLQPSAKEILEAIRALLLETHWHSFFILSDIKATIVLSGSEGAPLNNFPLNPTILQISSTEHNIFRHLAQISRSTRGVIILLCDLSTARSIMSEAQRLNMVGGHFIWIWADTTSTTEFFDIIYSSDTDDEINVDEKKFSSLIREEFGVDDTTINVEHNNNNNNNNDNEQDKILNYKLSNVEKLTNNENINRQTKLNNTDFMENNTNDKEYPVYLKEIDEKQNIDFHTMYYQNDENIENPFEIKNNNNNKENENKNINNNNHNYNKENNNNNNNHNNHISDSDSFNININNNNNENNNFNNNNNNNNNKKLKRSSNVNISSHVLFHHFQDFPIGLLALRPIRMNIDRHFIRSSVRLFASIWAKLETESRNNKDNRNKRYKRENKINNNNNNKIAVNNNILINSKNLNQSDLLLYNIENLHFSVLNQNESGLEKNINESNKTNILYINNNKSELKSAFSKRQTQWNIVQNKKLRNKNNNNNNNHNNNNKEQNRKKTPHYKGGCFGSPNKDDLNRAEYFSQNLKKATTLALAGEKLPTGNLEKPLIAHFELLNLVPTTGVKYNEKVQNAETSNDKTSMKWRRVGLISGKNVHLDTIVWPGGDIVVSGLSAKSRSIFRIVTALSPPFVMETELDKDGVCLRGLICHRLFTSGRHNLTVMFNTIETQERLKEDVLERKKKILYKEEYAEEKISYKTRCCYGLSMDLLDNIASDLGFEFHLYIVHDELFGAKHQNLKDWFDPTTSNINTNNNKVYNTNADIGGFEHKYNLNFKQNKMNDTKKSKFLSNSTRRTDNWKQKIPRSLERWNGIVGDLLTGSADMSFAALSVTKSRSEAIDFSIPYFHSGVSLIAARKTKSEIPLLAFLLPFSPELWIAIFTSLNITAIAVAVYEWLSPFGLNPWGRQRSKNFSMSSALWVMWGLLCGHLVAFKAPKSWPNKFLINIWGGFSVIFIASYTANIAALIAGLFFQNADENYEASLFTQRVGVPFASAAESYIRKNDRHLWEHIKKYTLKNIEDGIRALKNGTLDLVLADAPILDYYRATDRGCNLKRVGEVYVEDSYAIGMSKGFPLKDSISALIAKYSSNGYLDILTEKWYGSLPCFKLDIEIVQPRPLGVAAVAGVFLLLGAGMILGVLILIFEYLFYKYTLPSLRHKPKGTVWRSRNIMFFSQKLYRFINCVELVSPHHAARELVDTLRQGQIASLFQKSIKRKEDEQRRRRRSKAQFFEMIQEIRRVQQEEREVPLPPVVEIDVSAPISPIAEHPNAPPPKASPKPKLFTLKRDTRSRSNSSGLNVRRFSTDSIFGERLDTIGRRLSRDVTHSPADLGRKFRTFGKENSSKSSDINLSEQSVDLYTIPDKFDTFPTKMNINRENVEQIKENENKLLLRVEVNDTRQEKPERPSKHQNISTRKRMPLPTFQVDCNKIALQNKLHEELKEKYGHSKNNSLPCNAKM